MQPNSLLTELRSTTRAEHDRIDGLLRLLEPMPLERYAAILFGFSAFLSDWEPRLLAALPTPLRGWYAARQRARLAEADLAWLSSNSSLAPSFAPPTLPADWRLETLPEALGSLYVIEGSALGGRVIAPRIRRTLGLDAGRGASYFHGFGDRTGEMWADFRLVAEREIGDGPAATAAACASAKRTFAALIGIFEQVL